MNNNSNQPEIEMLRQELALFKSIFNQSPNGIVHYSTSGNVLHINQSALEIFGFSSPEQPKKHNLFSDSPIPPEKLNLLKSGQTIEHVCKLNLANLSDNNPPQTIYVRAYLSAIFDTNNQVAGFISQLRNVTDQVNKEELIKKERNRANNILQGTNAGHWTWNIQTDNLYINQRWAEIIGYSLSELEPANLKTWQNHTHPDDLKHATLMLDKIFSKQLDYYDVEFRQKHKHGHWVWVNARGKVTKWDENNKPLEMSGTHIDISAQKKVEEQLLLKNKQIAENEKRLNEAQQIAHIGSWELNLKTDKLIWSSETFRIFEASQNQFQNSYQSFLEFIYPEDRPRVNKHFLEHIEQKQKYDITHRIITPKGNIKYVHERCRTEFDQLNNPLYSIGTVLDVTQTILAQNELQKAKEKAEESDRLKTAFLNNMSHEIRTPLNAIVGFSEMLQRYTHLQEKRDKYTSIIIQSSQQLLNIVNDILEISRLESGLVKPLNETVQLNMFGNYLKQAYADQIAQKHLKFDIQTNPKCAHEFIVIDKRKVIQIIDNLMSNAIKFTEEGSINITCTLNNNCFEFSIQDTGIGIQHELQQQIFDRFRQLDDSTTRKYGGTGLGLAICKGLVNVLQGKMWLESELGKGSTFHFRIPYQKIEPSHRHSAPIAPKKNNNQKLILVAEDEFVNYQYIFEVLKNEKIQYLHAHNGQQAIELFKQNAQKINLIIMDIKMPVLDGIQATKAIKAIAPHIPVIALTANVTEQAQNQANLAGCEQFLTKPVRDSVLINAIKQLIG